MKKFTYLKLLVLMFSSVLVSFSVSGQKTVTVPGTYASITAALTGEFALLENNDELIINVAEGIVFAQGATNTNLTWPGKVLKITVQGAGADKTFQRAVDGRNARVATDITGTRLMQLSGTTGMEGSTLTFKNMTFQYLGSFIGNPAAGCVINLNSDFALDLTYENVVFDNCVGISVVNVPRAVSKLTINNCLFKECVGTPRRDGWNVMRGIIAKDGGNLIIRNTTFISNENFDISPTPSLNGYVINAQTTVAHNEATFLLENNAFVNNKNVAPDYAVLSPVVSLKPGLDATGAFNLTLNNNILIGNLRSGALLDTDISVINPEKITWAASSGNILTKVLKPGEEEGTYVGYSFAGSKIDPTYTYTDPRIAFEMDGDLPKLTNDANAIGKVTYTGDGGEVVSVKQPGSVYHKIYSFDRVLTIEGLKQGQEIEIFTIAGTLYTRATAAGDTYRTELPKGIYLVRSGAVSQKVLIH
jgi:hypothetical protein